jgi:hypothetical protein
MVRAEQSSAAPHADRWKPCRDLRDCLPALWLRRAKLGFANAVMETRRDRGEAFPLWLRRAKLGFANAVMETRGAYARGWNLS